MGYSSISWGYIYIYMDIKGDVVETKHVFGCV